MCKVRKIHLLAINGLMWTAIGTKISIPGIPEPFFAWFYLGLGPGLLSAGIRFLIRWWKAK